MKNKYPKILAVGLGCAMAIASSVYAAAIKTGYVTYSQPVATNSAQVIFPPSAGTAIRLVSVDVLGGAVSSTMQYMGGTEQTALLVATTVTATSTNLVVGSTRNFSTNDWIVVVGTNDYVWQGQVWFTNANGTNLYLQQPVTNAFPVGSIVYRLGETNTTIVSNSTMRVTGECLYQARRRMPLVVRVLGTGSQLNSATAKYDVLP